MAILSVSDVKTYLGISGSAEDAFLALALAGAESALLAYLGRPVETTTFTEYRCGNGSRILPLRNTPVQSITTVHLAADGYFGAGSFGSDDLLTAGTDYALEIEGNRKAPTYGWKGWLHRIGGIWPGRTESNGLVTTSGAAPGNIKIVYVAGWATVPDAIKQALYQYVSQIRMSRGDGGAFQSESEDYYSYSRISPADEAKAFGSVKSILAPYRVVAL